ncbi:MAG: GNAT family N-acetyltransferase [Candidatus Hermodarchaeota archaeon]
MVFTYQPIEPYESKLTTPTAALSHIKPGDMIFAGSGCAEPRLLTLHLSNMEIHTEDNQIYHVISLGSAPYIKEQYSKRFRYNSFFITNNIRQAVREGKADYTPVSSRKLPRLFRKKILPIDVALIQTSMPDESGYVSLGVSVDVTKAAVENARLVVAEINPEMPITLGDSFIHISEINYLVQNSAPLIEWSLPPVTPDVDMVARNVATLVEDESTLQFGFGKVPLTVPKYLHDKKDLGIHSEMISDQTLDLMEAGIVTNAKKTIHKGETIASFCVGTQRLYKAVNNNPKIKFYPSDYVLDPILIGKNHKMIAINSAIEVDLTGQVAADSLGHYLYSGIGGAPDLHIGAQRSIGGKGIIALPSTAKNEKKSRIVAQLSPGAGVAIDRANIEYIVTEYGIAYLHGATLRERVLDMVELAHPKFRKELFVKAKELGYIYQDQNFHDTSDSMSYPLEFQKVFTLKTGQKVRVRPILSSDEDKLRSFFYSLSPKSRFSRYFSAIRSLPHNLAQKEANINFACDWGIAAFLGPISSEKIIGTGHYYQLLYDGQTAEISLLVHEDFRSQGLARFFLQCLSDVAGERGITKFVTELMGANKAAIHLLKDFAQKGPAKNAKIERDGDVTILSWEIPTPSSETK